VNALAPSYAGLYDWAVQHRLVGGRLSLNPPRK
jgi:hypothetical protein